MLDGLTRTDVLLPVGREQQKNQPTSWLTAEGFNKEAGNAYIIYATKKAVSFHEVNCQAVPLKIAKHPLPEFIRENNMYSYTIVCYPLQAAVEDFLLTCPVSEEVSSFVQRHPDALAVYIVAHKTGGHKKLVSIGGDCYRPDRGNLLSMLKRTRDLATGMLRKSSLIFPDIAALTGGKKGEFGILNSEDISISQALSAQAIFELSAWVMPLGIEFLNHKKVPEYNNARFLLPDSLSPDVFTGGRWPAYTSMWQRNGVNARAMTCIQSDVNPINSSVPTAAGVIATTHALADTLLPGKFAEKKFLLEGGGGVGHNAVSVLMTKYQVPASNITVIDPSRDAVNRLKEFGVKVVCIPANEYYHTLSITGTRYDVWINNGVGDSVGLYEVIQLINADVKVFVGGANNLFLVDELEEILNRIASNCAYAFPDYACSGGGWTLAVLEQIRKVTGKLPGDPVTIIEQRNIKMVQEALVGFASGMDLWRTVAAQAEVKIQKTQSQHYSLTDADFIVANWSL